MLNKEIFISENQQQWEAKGDLIREMREAAGINVKDMAIHLGISPGRIKRFEAGWPVQDAKLIESAYKYVFKYLNLSKSITEALEATKED